MRGVNGATSYEIPLLALDVMLLCSDLLAYHNISEKFASWSGHILVFDVVPLYRRSCY